MDITLVIKIAVLGLVVAFAHQLLKLTGRDDIAMIAALAGLVIALMMVTNLVADLFDNVRRVFELY